MNVKVKWLQGLSFNGNAGTRLDLPLGAGLEPEGGNDGFRPLELMAISLAGCTAMDVISILLKKKQAVTAFEVKVQASQAQEFPKVFTHVLITYLITGRAVDEVAVLRAIELSAIKYCPAQAMLGKVVPIEMVYEIYEVDAGEVQQLVKQGKWQIPSIPL